MVLLAVQAEEEDPEIDRLAGIYLAFLLHAYNEESGRFRNFLNFEKAWLKETASEDSHGPTVYTQVSLLLVLGKNRKAMVQTR
jgi:hypothetical protein